MRFKQFVINNRKLLIIVLVPLLFSLLPLAITNKVGLIRSTQQQQHNWLT